MNIVGICSSPNKNGNTSTLLRSVLEGAQENGGIIEEVFLEDYDIKFCRGCFKCMAKGVCILSDDFNQLRTKVKKAKGIILASPNYAFSLNAMMKRFLERFGMYEFLTSDCFGGKCLVGVSTTGGQGAGKVASYLVSLFRDGIFQRGYVSGSVCAASGKIPVKQNEKIRDKAYSVGKKLVQDIKSDNTYPFQNFIKRKVIDFFIKPKFQGFISNGKNDKMEAVYKNLSERKLI